MSISVTVTISTVYPGSSGGAIFLGHDAAGKCMRFVAGRDRIFRAPIVGEVWALKGVSRRHAKYGEQVHIETAILAAPSGRLVVDFLVRHPAFKGLGIGKARARRLWEALGQDLGVVLGQGMVEKLTGVLSAECARKLVEAWQAVAEAAGIIAFLDHHGFDLHLANKVRTVWPRDTLTKLRENPYRMLAFTSWEKVDRMARSLGVANDDPRRRTAAVEACLNRLIEWQPDPLAATLPRQAGYKETRYAHLLSGEPRVQAAPLPVSTLRDDPIARLQSTVENLERELADLRRQFAEFRKQFE